MSGRGRFGTAGMGAQARKLEFGAGRYPVADLRAAGLRTYSQPFLLKNQYGATPARIISPIASG